MKIAIVGAGAMGMLYGGYLSRENEVYLVCTNSEKVNKINENGVIITEKDNSKEVFHPKAVVNSGELSDIDLLILFVKATASEEALSANLKLISPKTTVLTLQNGAGHEILLQKYVTKEQIAIGIAQDGSLLLSPNEVRHTGNGTTYFGKPFADSESLASVEETFQKCGFSSKKSDNIKKFIWEKLIFNASSSALSAVLGVRQGYCYEDKFAWSLMEKLVQEIVDVACADGISLDYPTQIARVVKLLTENPEGVPSICVDLKQGKATEVRTISGSVLEAGKRLSVPTPTQAFMVELVLAMEHRLEAQA